MSSKAKKDRIKKLNAAPAPTNRGRWAFAPATQKHAEQRKIACDSCSGSGELQDEHGLFWECGRCGGTGSRIGSGK